MIRSLLVVALLGACSSPPAPPPSPPAARPAPAVRSLELGHYRSAEGTVGLILDRRPKGARVKLDGTTEVIELDEVRAPGRTSYIVSLHKTMLDVFDDGRITLYLPQREDGIDLVRDGDVDLVSGVVTLKPAAACCQDAVAVTKDQPPEVKLKLGHYKNDRRGIGLVFDATRKPAKLRFDGSAEVIALDAIVSNDGVEYIRKLNEVFVRQSNDGHTEVWVPGAKTLIVVRRDGDADPL